MNGLGVLQQACISGNLWFIVLECLFEAVVLMSVIVHFKVAITVWYTCRLQQKYILWMT